MEQLQQENLHDTLSIKKMIFDIDTKITQTTIKINTSQQAQHDYVANTLNNLAKEHKMDVSFIKYLDVKKVKGKTGEKIHKLLEEDKKRKIGKC